VPSLVVSFCHVHILITRNDVHAIAYHLLQDGSTALVCAASIAHTQIVEMLLSHPDIDENLSDEVVSHCIISSCPIVNNYGLKFLSIYTFFYKKLSNRLEIPLLSGHLELDTPR